MGAMTRAQTTYAIPSQTAPRKARSVKHPPVIGESPKREAGIAADLEKLSARDRAYLAAPLILHSGGGEAAHLISKVVPPARLALLKNGERDLATEEEALAYLSSASLCFPLDGDHAEIMFYLTDRVMTRWYAVLDVWKQIGLESPPKLSAYQEGLLNELRGKIRRSAEKHGVKAKSK